MTYEQLKPLLVWRVGTLRGWTPVELASALSVEAIEKAGVVVPPKLEQALVGFRHRRQDGREALCRRFLKEGREPVSVPKPAVVRLPKTDRVTLALTRGRALELGLLTCECGHPENNHFDHGGRPCAHCGCKGYRERGISGVTVRGGASCRK